MVTSHLGDIFVNLLKPVKSLRGLKDVDDRPPVVVEDEVNNSAVIFGFHLNCKVLNWVFSIWKKYSVVKYSSNFLQNFTEIFLRKPGCYERHFKSIWKGVKSIKRFRIHGSHDCKCATSVASDATELKNEYFLHNNPFIQQQAATRLVVGGVFIYNFISALGIIFQKEKERCPL